MGYLLYEADMGTNILQAAEEALMASKFNIVTNGFFLLFNDRKVQVLEGDTPQSLVDKYYQTFPQEQL